MNNPLETFNLASITGVVVATMFIVEILKRVFDSNVYFNKIPVFVYAGLVSIVLVLIANHLRIDGEVILQGNIWKLLWAALIGALGSSGFYTWLKRPEPVATAGKLGGSDEVVIR